MHRSWCSDNRKSTDSTLTSDVINAITISAVAADIAAVITSGIVDGSRPLSAIALRDVITVSGLGDAGVGIVKVAESAEICKQEVQLRLKNTCFLRNLGVLICFTTMR